MVDQALARNFLNEAEAELASLRRRQRDLEALITSVRVFLNIDHPTGSFTPDLPLGEPRYGSKRQRIEAGIEQFLRDAGRPMHRMQIKEYLVEIGVVGTEKDPLANVSGILSTSKKFRPQGNGLWVLVETHNAVSEPVSP